MIFIPNRTFFVSFGGISGEFGRAMVSILARRSRSKIPRARPNEPDISPLVIMTKSLPEGHESKPNGVLIYNEVITTCTMRNVRGLQGESQNQSVTKIIYLCVLS